MWPTGLSEVSGKIPASVAAEPGRALGRLTDIGWGTALRELLAADDQQVPGPVVDAVVTVLAAWDWEQRPAAVMTIPSRTHPVLIDSLGQRIAAIGRIGYLGPLGYPDPPPGRRHNSAQRLRSVWNAFSLPADIPNGRVLLVDDLIDTGWTMTVAARLLREAGASGVLPFALAVTT